MCMRLSEMLCYDYTRMNLYIVNKETNFQPEKYLLFKNFCRLPKKTKIFYLELIKISNDEFFPNYCIQFGDV